MIRASGILLPVFCLPGKYGIGCFSKEAYQFVDFLEKAGQSYWQILPLGPTSYGDSPYQSFSTFAGNPYFISLEELIEQGLLSREECDGADLESSADRIDYGRLYDHRYVLLRLAYTRSKITTNKDFTDFIEANHDWIENYALYMAVKHSFGDVSFDKWDTDIRLRKPEALERYRLRLADDILFYQYLQYEFARQWKRLKSYANQKGIKIIGDIPIYVSYDSADVWANPQMFQLDDMGSLLAVAGCPPDGFSEKGQLWGNPLYDWSYHEKTEFAWWKRRIEKCTEWYDVIRIDHFRGLDQFYSIPAGAKDAVNGKWVDGPGMKLFDALHEVLINTPIIAEDLGFITDSVRRLVADTGYPNMKVIEFAFDIRNEGSANDYLPHNYEHNCVVYTGTHDNETLMGWLESIQKQEREFVREYAGSPSDDNEEIAKRLIRMVMMSTANLCIIPMQDYLLLDNQARINTPSTLGKNWLWRLQQKEWPTELAEEICKLTNLYGRRVKHGKSDN